MAGKVVDMSEFRNGTVTAEEVEGAMAKQEVKTDAPTTCICGQAVTEMDIDSCDICGEEICSVCSVLTESADGEVPICGSCAIQMDQEAEEALEAKKEEEKMSLKEAMIAAWESGVTSSMYGDIEIVQQEPSGGSHWAEWVRFGYFKREHVYWARRDTGEKTDGGRIRWDWIAVYLDSGRGKGRFFSMKESEGPEGYKAHDALQAGIIQDLIKKGKKWRSARHSSNKHSWQKWDLDKIFENTVGREG